MSQRPLSTFKCNEAFFLFGLKWIFLETESTPQYYISIFVGKCLAKYTEYICKFCDAFLTSDKAVHIGYVYNIEYGHTV